jgi:hypothetical protein
MPESDTSWRLNKGPQLDSLACREKLYHLLSLFFASPRIAELCDDEIGCPFRQMLDEHEEVVITRLLIETAVLIRMKDDLFEQQHGLPADANKDIVGSLCILKTDAQPIELTLREACNKLIHAKLINFDVEEKPYCFHERYLNPKIFAYGANQKGIEWKAEVDIAKWVSFGCTMFP